MNRLMQEFRSFPSSDPWDWNRTKVILEYCKIVQIHLEYLNSVDTRVQDEDYKFLQKIGRSLTEPPLFRSKAWSLLGYLHFICRYNDNADYPVLDPRGKAVRYLDAAIAAIDSMSSTDKERPFGDTTVGAFTTNMKESTLRDLEICAGCTKTQWTIDAESSAQGAALVAGLYCDCCMAYRDDQILKVCGDCRKAHYCGQACQRQAWNNGHKIVCRKTGEFRVGDVALTKDPFGTISYCHPVRIKAPTPNEPANAQSPCQWEVESLEDRYYGTKITKVVAASRLMRVRSGLWSDWTSQLDVVDEDAAMVDT